MISILNSPLNPISDKPTSHRSSQGVIYGDMLKQSGINIEINYNGELTNHNKYDNMYVYHGNDWSGSLNLFGGAEGYCNGYKFDNLINFSNFKGKIYSLNIDFPPYHKMIQNKINNIPDNIKKIWSKVNVKNLKRMHDNSNTIIFPNITDKLVLGDSHSICMYRPGWTINSIPFKTLNGALDVGLQNLIKQVTPIDTLNQLEVYFGNIDIRHHLCRLDSLDETKKLVRRYVDSVERLPIESVSIYEPLPIEDESRKIPKTGYYKNRPFWGTWEERNNIRLVFKDELLKIKNRVKVILWTDYLLNDKKQLDFRHMEKPQSVHLSRSSYPYWTGDSMNTLENFME